MTTKLHSQASGLIRRGRKMMIEIDGEDVYLDATTSNYSSCEIKKVEKSAYSLYDSSSDDGDGDKKLIRRRITRKEAIAATREQWRKETENLGGDFNTFKQRIPREEFFKNTNERNESDSTDTDISQGIENSKQEEDIVHDQTVEAVLKNESDKEENTPKKRPNQCLGNEVPVTPEPIQNFQSNVCNEDDSLAICSQQSTSTPKANHTIFAQRQGLSFDISSVLDVSDAPPPKRASTGSFPPPPVHPLMDSNKTYEVHREEIAKKDQLPAANSTFVISREDGNMIVETKAKNSIFLNENSERTQPDVKDETVQNMEVDEEMLVGKKDATAIGECKSSARRSALFTRDEKERELEQERGSVSSKLFVKPNLIRLSLLPKKQLDFKPRQSIMWSSSRTSIPQLNSMSQECSLREKYGIPLNISKVPPRVFMDPSSNVNTQLCSETEAPKKNEAPIRNMPCSRSRSVSPASSQTQLDHKKLIKTPQKPEPRKMLYKTPDRSLSSKLQESVDRLSSHRTPCRREIKKSTSFLSQDPKTPRPGAKPSILLQDESTPKGPSKISFLIVTEQAKSGKVNLSLSRRSGKFAQQRVRPLLDLDVSDSSKIATHDSKSLSDSVIQNEFEEHDSLEKEGVENFAVQEHSPVKHLIIDSDDDDLEENDHVTEEKYPAKDMGNEQESINSESELSDVVRRMSIDESEDAANMGSDVSSVRIVSPHQSNNDEEFTESRNGESMDARPQVRTFVDAKNVGEDNDGQGDVPLERISADRDFGDYLNDYDDIEDVCRSKKPISSIDFNQTMFSASGDTPILNKSRKKNTWIDSDDEIGTPARARFDLNESQLTAITTDDSLVIIETVEKENKTKEMQLAPRKIIKADEDLAIVSGRPQRNRVKPLRKWLGEKAEYTMSPGGSRTLTGVNSVTVTDQRYIKYGTCNLRLIAEKSHEERRRKATMNGKRKVRKTGKEIEDF